MRVSMDGRNVSLFSDDMVRENLKFYSDAAPLVDIDAPSRYATDFLMVPTDAPVLARLTSDSRWRRVYADSDSVLFQRAGRGGSVTPDLVALDSASFVSRKPTCEAFLD